MIDKRDLRIGNMFEQGIVWKISGRAGAKVHLHGKGKWYKVFRSEVDVEKLIPIPLTPKVLVEWCGFKKDAFGGYIKEIPSAFNSQRNLFVFSGDYLYLRQGNKSDSGGADDLYTVWNKDIKKEFYLHELQNLWHCITNKELEIKG